MRSKSEAAGDLCVWVIAVSNYTRLVNIEDIEKTLYLEDQAESMKNEIHELVTEYVALA